MRLLRVCIPILVALLIAAWGCTGGGTVASPTPASEEKGAEALDEEVPEGLVFRLTEGRPDQVQKRPPQAQASPLSEAQTRALLQRLPPLKEAQRRPFALREKSLPPPRPGKTVQQPFPPPQSPSPAPAVESGPLQVLRYSPQGEVPLAPFLSLTFSQPMVAVTSHAEAVQTRPVQLSPEPPGNWRWVGARTLLFQPQGRFPMATRYTVTVPAGTTSATGGKLAQATTFTFTTPPPNLESYFPSGGPTELNPLMFVAFDQKIQPEAVLKTIKVQAGNLQPGLRLASDQEIQADPGVRAASSRYSKDRWLAFRATQPLPPDTTVRVTVGPGTPSAEGPLTTTRPQEFSFRTYGPMKLVEARCGYDSECPPLMPWYLRFSNPIDTKRFDRSMVRVVPEVPALKVSVSGDTLYLSGNTRGRTHYTVTIEGTLPDRFGQTLGQTQTVDFRTTSAPPALHSIGGDFVVLDPDGRRTYSVFSINHRDLKVQLYAVTPGDWQAFRRFRESLTSEKPAPPPGKKVLDTSVRTQGQPDELTETAIDLSPALSQGLGQVVVVVQPAVQPKERWQRRYIVAWVQSTRIGLTAMVNHQSLVGWATSLKDGAPLEGVELEILPSGQKGTTGKDGLATLPLPEADSPASTLVGRLGPDLAFLPENTDWYGSGSWYRRPQADSLRWFVFDDRAMYRPSEEVHIKGWIRRIGAGPRGDVGALEGAVEKVSYVLTDSRGNQVLKGETRLGTLGGFSLAFTLPKTINLGPTRLELTASGGKGGVEGTSTTHILQVQEFRRPEFEVSASVASEGPTFVGGQATVGVTASYYAGGGLPG
ncbi:MAG TPA: Ig-like domain-containing protein, partial [Candidatus Nitrosotenuis sp.]|nr:Ig-like domain-containing protein [Candidatus Nitrosotenuis sp.]